MSLKRSAAWGRWFLGLNNSRGESERISLRRELKLKVSAVDPAGGLHKWPTKRRWVKYLGAKSKKQNKVTEEISTQVDRRKMFEAHYGCADWLLRTLISPSVSTRLLIHSLNEVHSPSNHLRIHKSLKNHTKFKNSAFSRLFLTVNTRHEPRGIESHLFLYFTNSLASVSAMLLVWTNARAPGSWPVILGSLSSLTKTITSQAAVEKIWWCHHLFLNLSVIGYFSVWGFVLIDFVLVGD